MTDSKHTTITVFASRYEDYDDCLAAAEQDAQERYGLQGWDLEPRWANDDREEIELTLPELPAGDLHDYKSGEYLRPATTQEAQASREAAEHDGGCGVIEVQGVSCYVAMEPDARQLRCVSDRYDSDGSVPYDSLEDFLAMCRDVHGEAPELTEHDGCYYEGDTLVMEICED